MRGSFAVLVFCSLASSLLAQNAKQQEPSVPSPTAASLGKFGDVPVSYFTGVPQISIPLFTVKGKTLELPISLDYHASGIKVEEIGGWVGMGWALEAGGVITRTVRGIADEKFEGYWKTGHVFYDPQNWTFPPPVQLVANMYNEVQDGEPDQFFFNFAGQSGEFAGGDTSIIHIDNPSSNIFVTIPYRKWRIQPVLGSDPFLSYSTIMSWIITTEDGTKYTFAAPEITLDRARQWQTSSGLYPQPYASSWYLTEIRSPGGDAITLSYTDYQAEHHLGMTREEITDTYEAPSGACGFPPNPPGGSTIRDLHSRSYHFGKWLTKIGSATDTILFHTSLRDDARSPESSDPGAPFGYAKTGRVQQEPKLDSITIRTPEGEFVKRFQFEYTYGGSLNGRLTLLNVFEKDSVGTKLPPYGFTYDGPTMPQRYTDPNDYHPAAGNPPPPPLASFALDFWGYYNGAGSGNGPANASPVPPGTAYLFHSQPYPGANRTPSFAWMKAGSLIKITYPTGGLNEFVYEANDFSWGGSLLRDDPDHLNQSAAITGPSGTTQTDFVISGYDPTVTVSLTVHIGPSPSCPQTCYVQLKQGASAITTIYDDNASQNPKPTFTLNRGVTYTLLATNGSGVDRQIAITAYWDERVLLTKKIAGGLRIKEVHADDGMGTVTVRKYNYQYDDGRSTGWITLGPRYDYDRSLISGDLLKQCKYYSRSSTPQNPLGNGLQVTYAQVTESLGVNGVFGVVRRKFNAGCDCDTALAAIRYNSTAPAYNTEYPFMRYSSNAWRRGEPVSTEELSASGALQRASSFTYATPPSLHPTVTFRGLGTDVYSMVSRWWNGFPMTTTYFIWAWRFNVQTALKVQTAQTTTFYDTLGTPGTSFSTTKQFIYGNPSHSQLTETIETNSDGTQRITDLKYPGDFATGGAQNTEAGALAAMQDVSANGAHMPGVVIERSVSEKNASGFRVVQADVTTYLEFNGRFLPYKHYVLSSPSPIQ